jgi:hypothetical protein
MIKVEPTGVLFVGVCDIQTEVCTARTAAPVTAVWTLPARTQVNVCRSCLDEMVRQGEWQVEGARLRRRADVEVFDHAGNLLVSEWINDLLNLEDQSQVPDWVRSSGLYQAIKDGAAVEEAAV